MLPGWPSFCTKRSRWNIRAPPQQSGLADLTSDCFCRAPETGDASEKQPIYSDAGYYEHHSGGQYNFNIRIAEMRTDYDNGLGTTQQTHKEPDDPFRHINRRKHNLLAEWEEFTYTDVSSAYKEILKQYGQLYGTTFSNPTDLFTYLQTNLGLSGQALQDQETIVAKEILYDAICKYNHGTGVALFALNAAQNTLVVIDKRVSGNFVDEYVNNVIDYHNEFNLTTGHLKIQKHLKIS